MLTVWLKRIVATCFGIFLAVLLLEGGLRLGGAVFGSLQEYENLKRLRETGTYRILCLGESTTAGQYPRFLEEILNQSSLGVRFSVIDKGRPGISTRIILDELPGYLNEYRPDMVVTMMGINDRGKHLPPGIADGTSRGAWGESFRTYKLFRLLWWRMIRSRPQTPPNDPVPHTIERTVRLFLSQGNIQAAENLLRRTIEADPGNEAAVFELGWLYLDRREYAKGEKLFEEAIRRAPKNSALYFELGRLYRVQGKNLQAEELLKRSIALKPQQDEAYLELGGLYRQRGQIQQAQNLLHQGRLENPGRERLRRGLGSLAAETGQSISASPVAPMKRIAYENNDFVSDETARHYRALKEILGARGILLVCVQYPVRRIKPLEMIFTDNSGLIFVDNETAFKSAIGKEGYKAYFTDMFAGDFGHCTAQGNKLLAGNIAREILRHVFPR